MKILLIAIISQIVPLGCVAGSIILALNGVNGWGWLLVVSLLLGGFSYKPSNHGEKKDKADEK